MTARTKARIILPMVQVVIAAALVVSNLSRPEPVGEDTIPDSRYSALDIQYCWGLNSPAAMIAYIQREATYELLKYYYPLVLIVNLGALFSLIWLLWYAVSIEIGGKGLSVLTPKTRVRRAADVLAIAFGGFLLVYADFVTRSVLHPLLVTPVHIMWALAIVGFYGHDLWASFRTPRIESAGKTAAT